MRWLWLLLIPALSVAQEAGLEGFSQSSVLAAVGPTKGRVETLRTEDAATGVDQVLTRCDAWRDDAGEPDGAACTLVSHCVRPGFFAVARGNAPDGSFRIGVSCGAATRSEARVGSEKACNAAGATGCELVTSSMHEL